MTLDIDSRAVVVFTNKLEKFGRSALPVVIRQTLNNAAFDVKKITMPKSARLMTQRTATFFKANSRVEMAQGLAINSMKAMVGFTSEHLRIQSTNYAVKDLEQQEHGGDIKSKSFIPLNPARKGNDYTKVVSPANRLTNLDLSKVQSSLRSNINKKGGSPKAAFRAAAAKAGSGGLVIGNQLTAKGSYIVWKIESINAKGKIKMKPLYTYKPGREVHPKATYFMEIASLQSANRLEEFYIKNAEARIEKALR